MIEGRTSGQSRPKPRGGSRFSSSDLQIADYGPRRDGARTAGMGQAAVPSISAAYEAAFGGSIHV